MRTCFGVVADRWGLATAGGRAWSTPAEAVLGTQDRIPVDRDHDGVEIGEVVHLERTREGALWAVAHVRDDVSETTAVRVADELVEVDTPLYWSATRLGDETHGIALLSLALTPSPARAAAEPVSFLPGQLGFGVVERRWGLRSGHDKELLTRAASTFSERRWTPGAPIYVHEYADARLFERATPYDQMLVAEQRAARQLGPLRLR